MCFSKNPIETLDFFATMRRRSHILKGMFPGKNPWYQVPKSVKAPPRMRSYQSFAEIEYLSTASAVVMTAEYARLAEISKFPPITIDLHKWSDVVFAKLYELDFFSVVGITETVADLYAERDGKRTMRILSGTNNAELAEATRRIQHLAVEASGGADLLGGRVELISTALSEAISNVARHAYPADHDFQFPHVGRWWLTAEFDRSNGMLTIVIYDQGATIPVTLPYQDIWSKVKLKVAQLASSDPKFDFANDGAYIEGSLKAGVTSTGDSHRGKGLAEMVGLIDELKAGYVSIFSRGGYYRHDYTSGKNSGAYPSSIGGTLIEWGIQVHGANHG
ncbi:ATP-binding protein [Loktanella sp. 3ANDIMAR09]|uniref:ATP-binding protein n=1 Tax=Loktanella sp. 3ANDIMAR09 TaxID=1225657 RepID=UPI00155E1F33|nr:ATP-binding protein [Loktanella sp. 3ANDIMAR09]